MVSIFGEQGAVGRESQFFQLAGRHFSAKPLDHIFHVPSD